MAHYIRPFKRSSSSAKSPILLEPSVTVKRIKGIDGSYSVKVSNTPYCIVETSPYMVWDPDHTFKFSISEQYKKRILELIHALENA